MREHCLERFGAVADSRMAVLQKAHAVRAALLSTWCAEGPPASMAHVYFVDILNASVYRNNAWHKHNPRLHKYQDHQSVLLGILMNRSCGSSSMGSIAPNSIECAQQGILRLGRIAPNCITCHLGCRCNGQGSRRQCSMLRWHVLDMSVVPRALEVLLCRVS
mmetsp:Transcript_40127/g.126926  ORF Transcript_40127/g.126926 Transcript_40127/m.126926 type:complete len:162 (-) Transcript_40127:86-571(-)